MRPLQILLAVVALVTVACGPSGRPEDVEFAPLLDVDLASMNKADSGLYLQDRVVGTGTEAVIGETAVVDYRLWFPDGRLVQSSYEGTQRFAFVLGAGQVIKGWEEGVVGMKAGGIRLLVLPSDLAYGPNGSRSIPGNQVLVFEIELHEVR